MSGFSRFIGVVLGIIVIAAGVYLLIEPEIAFLTTGIVIGAGAMLAGLADLIMWNSMRKNDVSNGWHLISAVLSIAVGCFILFNYRISTSVSIIMLYIIAVWMIVNGISKTVQSAKLKNLSERFPNDIKSGGWVWMLIFGILIIIAGIASIINPLILILSLGLMLGIDLIIVGLNIFITAISA